MPVCQAAQTIRNTHLVTSGPLGDGPVGQTSSPVLLQSAGHFFALVSVATDGLAAYVEAAQPKEVETISLTNFDPSQPLPAENPPAFNVPAVVVVLGALLVAVHAVFSNVSDDWYSYVIFRFAFIPLTYELPLSELLEPAARYWSPLTYAFLHGDWMHLGVNAIWLLAFGSAVARRFGSTRFLIFMAIGAVAGAAFHYIFHPTGNVPVIGASASISACMGAAIRFAIRPGGTSPETVMMPALSLLESLKNRSIMIFIVIWFAINWVAGTGVLTPGEAGIAWEAHMGGFLIGWLGFAAFDPVRR